MRRDGDHPTFQNVAQNRKSLAVEQRGAGERTGVERLQVGHRIALDGDALPFDEFGTW